ncbi:MAG: hypothetical protein PVH30_03570 [Desulfobacterales bacterium]|jgi:hypothetical protein
MPDRRNGHGTPWPTLSRLPVFAKALLAAMLLTLALAMVGALGQIIVHDIIPTFFPTSGSHQGMTSPGPAAMPSEDGRGDLFADAPDQKEPMGSIPSFYRDERFVWTLKWSHIHLFGMNMIFFFLSIVTIFLDMAPKAKAWLVVLPFIGVVVDIAAIWLKGFLSPAFFWLHIPGGGLFVGVFLFVFFRAFSEMFSHAPGR